MFNKQCKYADFVFLIFDNMCVILKYRKLKRKKKLLYQVENLRLRFEVGGIAIDLKHGRNKYQGLNKHPSHHLVQYRMQTSSLMC